MLKKLLKYDLKWCFKPLIVFYILSIFFAIMVRIVESFEQSLIILIIDKICCGVLIAMIINNSKKENINKLFYEKLGKICKKHL